MHSKIPKSKPNLLQIKRMPRNSWYEGEKLLKILNWKLLYIYIYILYIYIYIYIHIYTYVYTYSLEFH